MSEDKGDGRRQLAVRLKTAKKRTTSQQNWLKRQLNDPYVAKARADGYRSRAAYKLIEIDDKLKFLKPGARVVDLGCAPGGWLQVASKRIGLEKGKGALVGIDILPCDPIGGATILHLDFTLPEAPNVLKDALGGDADIVLSDMAANTTGHRKTDHLRIVHLAELAIHFARDVLSPGGTFVCKMFQGGTENDLLNDLKRDFTTVKHIKPAASRADSAELYVYASGFRGKGIVSYDDAPSFDPEAYRP